MNARSAERIWLGHRGGVRVTSDFRAYRFLLASLLLAGVLVPAVLAQVSVSARTTKSEYLVGEPIVLVLEIKNVGDDLVAYGGGCDSDIKTTVAGISPEPTPRYGCSMGVGGGGCAATDHPPRLKIGESTSLRMLLKGYRLPPGAYSLEASGKVPVYWKYYASEEQKHDLRSPVPGREFSQDLPVRVRLGTEEELKEAYAPLIAAAKNPVANDRHEAEEAIAEMAPEFLENQIVSFADDQYGKQYAVIGLDHLNTTSSRRALVQLYDKSADILFRRAVVEALAELGNPEQLEFFASLFPGRQAGAEEEIRISAVRGLGRIGGAEAVDLLAHFHAQDQRLENERNYALGNSRSKEAVSALIESWTPQSQNSICGALGELTHRSWCSGDGTNPIQSWKQWWKQHQSKEAIYGEDSCSGALNGPPIG
jgi:hypothetical protein